jgi:DNA-binding MarR family transcriptional regulator
MKNKQNGSISIYIGPIPTKAEKRVVSFALKNPNETFYAAQITRVLEISSSYTNRLLNSLLRKGLIYIRKWKGRRVYYELTEGLDCDEFLRVLEKI